MAYKITFQPLNRIKGVTPSTVTIEGAREAWKQVDGLIRSDERVEIETDGVPISPEELRRRAEYEGSHA